MLTDALEMHFIDMVKWRKQKEKDLNNPLHRWMVYFDERSPAKLVNGLKAIQAAEDGR